MLPKFLRISIVGSRSVVLRAERTRRGLLLLEELNFLSDVADASDNLLQFHPLVIERGGQPSELLVRVLSQLAQRSGMFRQSIVEGLEVGFQGRGRGLRQISKRGFELVEVLVLSLQLMLYRVP
jgi:hypothetical protein